VVVHKGREKENRRREGSCDLNGKYAQAEPENNNMRIIAGKYRGRKLRSPVSTQVRPTSDRLRETLFNVIAPRIEGVNFLDLCAGSGAVGIEALSRGAAHVTFVDRARAMQKLITTNLDLVQIKAEPEVIRAEAGAFVLEHIALKRRVWDIVFFDPPYNSDYDSILELFAKYTNALLKPSGLLIVEHYHKNVLREEIGGIRRTRTLKQGESVLSFYQPSSIPDSI